MFHVRRNTSKIKEDNKNNSTNKRAHHVVTMITTLGLLIALEVVLTRFFKIEPTITLRFSFGFVAFVIAGMLYGPVASAGVAALADFCGAILFPTGGAYFPGFTVTAFLTGLVLGLFLYKKQNLFRIIVATLITQVFGSLLLNAYWLSLIISGKSYSAILITRSLQGVIMSIIMIISIQVISKQLLPRLKPVLTDHTSRA